MQQILFHIPILGIPIYGYGLMLFFAYLFCTALAKRLCKWQGINGDFIPDLAIWLFISALPVGRTVYVMENWRAGPLEISSWSGEMKGTTYVIENWRTHQIPFSEWYWNSVTDNSIIRGVLRPVGRWSGFVRQSPRRPDRLLRLPSPSAQKRGII